MVSRFLGKVGELSSIGEVEGREKTRGEGGKTKAGNEFGV